MKQPFAATSMTGLIVFLYRVCLVTKRAPYINFSHFIPHPKPEILAVLRGGAEGGPLTPGLTVGALLSLLLAVVWQFVFPGGDVGSFALVGGAAFLAASMQMLITAVALVMEFTHMDHSYFAPALLCAAGAYTTCRVLDKKYHY